MPQNTYLIDGAPDPILTPAIPALEAEMTQNAAKHAQATARHEGAARRSAVLTASIEKMHEVDIERPHRVEAITRALATAEQRGDQLEVRRLKASLLFP